MTREDEDVKEAVPPPLPEGWTRCRMYMKQKRRFCRQQVVGTSYFCGHHQSHAASAVATVAASDVQCTLAQSHPVRIRIPCPLDPSHDVAADKVEQHVKKCPALKKRQQLEEAPYFCRDMNKGGNGGLLECDDRNTEEGNTWAQRIAVALLRIYQRVFTGETLDEEGWRALALEQIENALVLEDHSTYEMNSGLPNAIQMYRIKSGGPKHLQQQASLVGHLRQMGALPPPENPNVGESPRETKKARASPRTFFEMGAGRGMLGIVVGGVSATTNPTKLIFVERSGSRSRADTVLRNLPDEAATEEINHYMNLHALQKWSRIQCDLAHVNLASVVKEENVCGIHVIAKHLCGAGTDIALKALLPVRDQLSSCLFATCCHGVCNWEDYVGRDYLRKIFATEKIKFGKAEFELLRRWSAATVLSSKDGSEEHPSVSSNGGDDVRSHCAVGRVVESLGLSCGAQGVGRCCQRLIDEGRREFIQHVLLQGSGASTRLRHYAPASVTPQNAVITGCRSSHVRQDGVN